MDKETELIIKWLNENGHAKVTSKIIPLDNGNFRPVVYVIYNCLQQVKKFDLADVVGQSEQLKAFLSTMIDEFDNGEVSWETRDSAESLLKSL